MAELILNNFSNYVINDSGNNEKSIWSIQKNKWLKPFILNSGHLVFCLVDDCGKRTFGGLHRWIAKAFIENPNNYDVVHHKDHNPQNNKIENLQWISKQDHCKLHSSGKTFSEDHKKKISVAKKGKESPLKGMPLSANHRKKLSEAHIGKPRLDVSENLSKAVAQYTKSGELIATYKSLSEAAQKTDCHVSNISSCCKGKRNSAKGFIWRDI